MKSQKNPTAKPSPKDFFTCVIDLGLVWDCHCELQTLYECVSAIHLLFCEYANEDAKSICVLLCVLAEKLNECSEMLSKTINQATEVKS